MPPKQKAALQYPLYDDAGNQQKPEEHCEFLEKKLRIASKPLMLQPSPDLVQTLRNVGETENKELKGVPFTAVTFTDKTSPEQLGPALGVLEKYPLLERLHFRNARLTVGALGQVVRFLELKPEVTQLQIDNSGLDQDLLKFLFSELYRTGVRALTLTEAQFTPEALISAGVQVHKYAARALNRARAVVAEAKKRHEEELRLEKLEEERLKELGQKPPKKPKKTKRAKDELYLRDPHDLYPEYFRLDSLAFEFCQIGPDCATALTVFVQKAAQHVAQISLKGNDLGSAGLRGIAIGFEEAFKEVQWRARRQAQKKEAPEAAQVEDSDFECLPPDPEEAEIRKTCAQGSPDIRLQTLDLELCNVGPDKEALEAFGRSLNKAGNLHEISLYRNPIGDNFYTVIFGVEEQPAITKLVPPRDIDGALIEQLAGVLRAHQKLAAEAQKRLKRLEKERKRARKQGATADDAEHKEEEPKK